MKDFIDEVDELLHANPYSSVNILPIVLKHTENKNDAEVDNIRQKMLRHLNSYKQAGYILFDNEFMFKFSVRIYHQYSDEPLLIASNGGFEKEYARKHTPPVQPITYNGPTINAPHSTGPITQISGSSLVESAINHSVTTTPSIKPSATKIIRWYNSTLFKCIVYPLLVGLILWLVSLLIKKSP